jgi:hypothetical protein
MMIVSSEVEKSICDSILLISRARQQGDNGLKNKYNEQLKPLEFAYANMNKDRMSYGL